MKGLLRDKNKCEIKESCLTFLLNEVGYFLHIRIKRIDLNLKTIKQVFLNFFFYLLYYLFNKYQANRIDQKAD